MAEFYDDLARAPMLVKRENFASHADGGYVDRNKCMISKCYHVLPYGNARFLLRFLLAMIFHQKGKVEKNHIKRMYKEYNTYLSQVKKMKY